jgi:hypothetical protein
MTIKPIPLIVALALTGLPLAAHAEDYCSELPTLLSSVDALTTQARGLIQTDSASHPGVTGLAYTLNDLDYMLVTVIPATRPYADSAASHGTPGGGAWGYQVHSQVIYAQGLEAELNDAEHWLIGVIAVASGVGYQNSYEAVDTIVKAHNAATSLDRTAMFCYLAAAASYSGLHL